MDENVMCVTNTYSLPKPCEEFNEKLKQKKNSKNNNENKISRTIYPILSAAVTINSQPILGVIYSCTENKQKLLNA